MEECYCLLNIVHFKYSSFIYAYGYFLSMFFSFCSVFINHLSVVKEGERKVGFTECLMQILLDHPLLTQPAGTELLWSHGDFSGSQ